MAGVDGTGAKDYVEGYANAKLLERITKPQQLQEYQRQFKKEEVELNVKLQQAQRNMMDLQNKLNECNEKYAEEKTKLEELRSQQKVTLNTDQESQITAITKDTINSFLAPRPSREDDQVTVDVHFLTGVETTSSNIHIGSDGAGSRDAKFLVRLNQKVQSLATQAAKYWGLDPAKVFFLDRDGRIVPDNMNLSDIILPPVPASSSSSSAPEGSTDMRGGVLDGIALQLTDANGTSGGGAIEVRRDLFTVKGRNYCLTLVRASTVLSKEDLNRPKGEKWEDFTFNAAELNKELENTRKKRGEQEGEADKVSMDEIPSLFDLIQQGQAKKRRKQADTRCRLIEFFVFVLCATLFYVAIAMDSTKMVTVFLVSQGARAELANFTNTETAILGLDSFREVTRPIEYQYWLEGPLQRSLVEGSLQKRNLYVLAAVARTYTGTPPSKPWFVTFCGDPGSSDIGGLAGANGSNGSASNSSMSPSLRASTTGAALTTTTANTPATFVASATTSKAATTTSKAATTTSKAATTTSRTALTTTTAAGASSRRLANATSTSAPATSSAASALRQGSQAGDQSSMGNQSNQSNTTQATNSLGQAASCIPPQLKQCLNRRVMEVLAGALASGDQVPLCQPLLDEPEFVAWLRGYTAGSQFSYVRGKVASYSGGYPYQLEFNNGTDAWADSLAPLLPSPNGNFAGGIVAHAITVFVYAPSMNNLMIIQLLMEQTLAGSLVTSTKGQVILLSPPDATVYVAFCLVILLAIACLLMELRRIMAWPKRLTFEDEPHHCSFATALYILLPILLLVTFLIFVVRHSKTADDLLQLSDDVTLTSQGVAAVYNLTSLDDFIVGLELFLLVIFNFLFLRYLLMYFPQLAFMGAMVRRLMKPILSVLFFLFGAVLAIGVWLYAMYSADVYDFRDIISTATQTIRFIGGGVDGWFQLYTKSPSTWIILISISFVLVSVTLNALVVAIMFSHKREKDLFENYSYHPFWSSERSGQGGKDPKEFNPAAVGWDFTGKEPRQVG